MTARKKGLGRGIGALIPQENLNSFGNLKETNDKTENNNVNVLDLKLITPNKDQPRKVFDEEKLQELTDSVKEFGVLQPILVTKKGEGYVIVAGERRFRAAKNVGLKEIPVVIKDLSDKEILEIALIENLQRNDLNPIEEALGLQKLHDEFFLSFEDLAKRIGRSKGSISNTLSLLKLSQKVQDLVFNNKLKTSHARALLKITDKNIQYEVADEAIERDLSLGMLEMYIDRILLGEQEVKEKPKNEYAAILNKVEDELQQYLGLKVKINDKNKKGKIEINYTNHDELDSVINLLKNN